MSRRVLAAALAAILASLPAAAQFYTQGCEPAGVRWMQLGTQDYKVIYPRGLDSLARVYASILERVKGPVGATAGYLPNQNYRKPLPVIIHPWTANANGMVTWSPSRMELFSTPDYLAPLAAPWEEHLVIHESRHVAQMQFINERPYKPYVWLTGQLFAGAASTLYCGPAFFEGDAVVAETELTATGRGRQASFLEYYRAAFREGDTRDWWKWRYGSLRRYTPDYYTIGYVRAAGLRSVYGAQDFTERYYRRIFRHPLWPWPMFNFQKTVQEVTGKKYRAVFTEIADTLTARWQRDEASRAPFMPAEQVTPSPRRFRQYVSGSFLGDSLYAIRSGLAEAPALMRIAPDGSARKLSNFSYSTSALRASEPLRRLYWSEIRRHERWDLVSYSEIWYCGPDGRHRRLTERTRWYNPSVAPDGMRLAVTEFPPEGGSALVVIDALDGSVLERYDAPGGLQIAESAWVGGSVLVSCVGRDGSGIYDACDGFRLLCDCGTAVLKDLFAHEGKLHFTADLTGVDELYRLEGDSAVRLTSSPQGGGYYRFHADTLVYSALDAGGRHIFKTPVAGITPAEADFGKPHRYEFAPDLEAPYPVARDSVVALPDPVPYNKLLNAFRLHSWAPIYVNYDAVSDASFEDVLSSASLGATGFFHNDLSSIYGTVAYGAFYDDGSWTHKGEAKVTLDALYPKIEASVSVSSDPAKLYFMRQRYTDFSRMLDISVRELSGPSASASLLMYVPLSFSSGGWYRGVIPQVRLSVTNDIFTFGRLAPMNRVSASLRGYVVSATPSACLYPRLGMGFEAGWSGRAGVAKVLTPNAYLYGYGYLPGLMDTHGLKITATFQTLAGGGYFSERYASVLPRGMGSASSLASRMATSPLQLRVTADYAFPFLPLDWSGLGPVAYVRNLECTLHADVSRFAGGSYGNALLGSAGATLDVVLGNLLWLPFDTRIGARLYRNFGTPYSGFDPWSLSLDFSVDL